jgi:S1-C subfamily serine protease
MQKALFGLVFLGLGIVVGWIGKSGPLVDAFAQGPAAGGPATPTTLGNLPSGTTQVAGILADSLTPEERINITVYETCNRGVVNITTESTRLESIFTAASVKGSGSGSVLDRQGNILTNYHVIEGARDVTVALYTGDYYPAELVGADPDNDIAIVRIKAPAEQLHPIPLGDSTHLRVGQRILAIGNPFGLERTMSDGIISSLNRQLPSRNRRSLKSIIQINAALNQGNSGGPLLNTRGELIGMNTAIATSTGDNAGIGFAIPVSTIRRLAPQLMQFGKVTRPTIGIERVWEKADQGLVVVKLTPNGPADQAGIQASKILRRRAGLAFEQTIVDHSSADLIVGIDGLTGATADGLLTAIESKKAGDQVILTVLRNGRTLNVPITLGVAE